MALSRIGPNGKRVDSTKISSVSPASRTHPAEDCHAAPAPASAAAAAALSALSSAQLAGGCTFRQPPAGSVSSTARNAPPCAALHAAHTRSTTHGGMNPLSSTCTSAHVGVHACRPLVSPWGWCNSSLIETTGILLTSHKLCALVKTGALWPGNRWSQACACNAGRRVSRTRNVGSRP